MKNKQVLVLYGTKIYRRKLYGKEKEKKNYMPPFHCLSRDHCLGYFYHLKYIYIIFFHFFI